MKKSLIATLLVVAAVISFSSCRSKHGTCAAYSQAPVKKVATHI